MQWVQDNQDYDLQTIQPLPDQSGSGSLDCESTDRIRRKPDPQRRQTPRRKKHRSTIKRSTQPIALIMACVLIALFVVVVTALILFNNQKKSETTTDQEPTADTPASN